MRPLEEVLQDLADQDERLATSELIARIERSLADSGDVPLVVADRRLEADTRVDTVPSQRRRWMPAVVVAGAALLVIVAIGVPILLLNGGGSMTADEPTSTVVSATTVPPDAASFPALSGGEMVGVADLPEGVDWATEPGGDVHFGWCTDASLQDPVNHGPLASLSARAAVQYGNGAVGIEQVVFADDPATADAAFGEIRQRALACINDRDQWAPSQAGGRIIGQSDLSMKPIGDARFAIWSTAAVGDRRVESLAAVVLKGSRIIVVQSDEAFGADDGPNHAGRTDFRSVVDAAVDRSSGVSPIAELADQEMLTTGDLPGHSDWQVFDETDGADNINGWSTFEHGVLAVRCDYSLNFWRLDPSPRSHDLDRPYTRLDNAQFRAMYADRAVFGEALYSGAPAVVTEAFNTMKSDTFDCLSDQSQWATSMGLGGGGQAQLLPIQTVGDDSITIKMKIYLASSRTKYDLFRLAVIRDGTRLLVVEEHETVMSADDPPLVSDTEFAAVVHAAIERLDSDPRWLGR